MSIEYSAWNIDRNNRPLGVELVNPSGHYFFIYAEKLIALYKRSGEYVLVKNKDRHSEKAAYHHPGEVFGRLELLDDGYCSISLSFGYAGQIVEYDKDNDCLIDIYSTQHHVILTAELASLAHVLSCMYIQRERFIELKLLSEMHGAFR